MSSLDLINRPWQARKLEGPTLLPGGLDSLNRLKKEGSEWNREKKRSGWAREELLWDVPRCSTEITSLRATGTLPHPCYQTNKTLASTRFRKLSPDTLLGVIPVKLGCSLLPAEILCTAPGLWRRELCDPDWVSTRPVMFSGAPAEPSWCFASKYSAPAFVVLHKELAWQARAASPTKCCFSWLSFGTIREPHLECLWSLCAWPGCNRASGFGSRGVDNITVEGGSP